MLVVECPKCNSHYNPECEEALKAAGDAMSIKVPCPECGQWVRLPEWECVETPNAPDDVLKKMVQQSKLLPKDDNTPVAFGPIKSCITIKPKPWWAFWR